MKPLVCAALAASLLLATGMSHAQVTEDSMGKILPVSLSACNFRDGQDQGDLDRVNARWNRFLDENNVHYYSAWTLTPYFYGPNQDFDLIWMGAYRDGNAFGAGEDMWMTSGGDLSEAYSEVLDCMGQMGLSSAMYKAPPNNPEQSTALITMMDCELNEGHRYMDVRRAEVRWAEHLESVGSTAGIFHWYPRFGGGDAEFDYKVIHAYANFSEMGNDMERRMNGGDFAVSRDIFRDVDECDDARVYIATVLRVGQIR
jgi:hypothetical protein